MWTCIHFMDNTCSGKEKLVSGKNQQFFHTWEQRLTSKIVVKINHNDIDIAADGSTRYQVLPSVDHYV